MLLFDILTQSLNPLFNTSDFIFVNYFDVLCYTSFNEGHARWPKHVASYAVYTIINLHICVCTVGFTSHNESSVLGHESFKITFTLLTETVKCNSLVFGTSGSSALPLSVADEGTSVYGGKVWNDERQISVAYVY